jgi:hypothetical protein
MMNMMCPSNMVPVHDHSQYLTTLLIVDPDISIKSHGSKNNDFCFHNKVPTISVLGNDTVPIGVCV